MRSDMAVSSVPDAALRVVSLIGFPPACSACAAAFGDDELFERVETRLPKRAIVLDPIGRRSQRPRTERAAMLAPYDSAVHQARALEHSHMLRHSGQRDLERLGDFGDEGVTLGEPSENRPARWVGQCAEYFVELGIVIFNHMVEYAIRSCTVKSFKKDPH